MGQKRPGAEIVDFVKLANAAPGDSLVTAAYSEFGDSLTTLTLVAEPPDTVTVPAGRFAAVPLRGSGFRLYVTRTAPPGR